MGLLLNNEISRFSRHLLLEEVGVKGQKALLDSKVLVIGCGGLGAPCLMYLAGHLGLVDYDIVEINNLQRQVIHSELNVGIPKTQSAKMAIHNLFSGCVVDEYNVQFDSSNALEILSGYDVVVDCSDNVATRYLLNDACVLSKKPLVSGSALRFDGQLTVYNFDDGPCYRCLFPIPPPANTVTNCNDGGVLGAITGTIGSLQALEVIKIIIGSTPNYHKKLLLFDGKTGIFKSIKLRNKNENCIICGTHPTQKSLDDYVLFCGSGPDDKSKSLTILSPIDRITVHQFKSILDNQQPHILLDVRPLLQYDICNLPNSLNIPIKELSTFNGLTVLNNEITKIAKSFNVRDEFVDIYVICRRGNQSQNAVVLLKQIETYFEFIIKDVVGGITEWTEIDPLFPTY